MEKILNEVLRAQKAIVTKNPVLPIVEGVNVENGYFHVTNVDHSILIKGAPDYLNGKVFFNLDNAMKIKPDAIEVEEGKILFRSGTKKVCVPYNSNKEFPILPGSEMINMFYLDGTLGKIKKAIPFVSNDELRPAMCGICLNVENDKIEIVSTNAHYLYRSQQLQTNSVEDGRYIIDVKIAKYLTSIKDVTSVMAYIYKKNHMSIQVICGDGMQIEIVTRLIDARYPDYNAVIPLDNPNTYTVSKKQIIEVLTEAQQFANKSTNQIDLNFETLKISSQDLDLSLEYSNELPGEAIFEADPFVIGLNAKNMLSTLKVCEGETMTYKMSTPSRAVCGLDVSGDLFLNMPVVRTY